MLRAWRPLSPALVPPHDGYSRARGRCPRDRRRLLEARSSRDARGARGRHRPAAQARRRARHRGARFRYRDTIPRVDKIVGPGNAYVAAAKALVSSSCAIDFFAGPSEILIVLDARPAGLDRCGPAGSGGTRSRTPGRSSSRRAGGSRARSPPKSDGRCRRTGPAAKAVATNGAIIVTRSLDEALALSERMAPEHVVCDSPRRRARLRRAGTVFVGVVQRTGLRRLRDRLEPRPPDVRRRARTGRADARPISCASRPCSG